MYMNDTEYQKFKDSRFYGYFDLLKEEIARLGQMGVQFLFFQTPLRQNIKNLSEFEQQRLDHWEFDFNHITDRDCEMIGQIYPPEVTTDYLQQVYDGSRVYEKNGIKYLADFSSRYVNVIMGHRITMDCPQQYDLFVWTVYRKRNGSRGQAYDRQLFTKTVKSEREKQLSGDEYGSWLWLGSV